MSRPIAYNKPGAAINGSITNEDAVISYVVDGRGNDYYNNYESCTWVPSADGAAPIVFVTDTFTRGYEGDPNLAVPLFFACAGTSSAAILYTANRLPGSPGNYTNANTALDELNRIYGYFILESNDPFQGINATDLAFDVDASKMTSYPQTGTSWYDLSGNGNTLTLYNGVGFDPTGYFTFDGTDDNIRIATTNFNKVNGDPITVSITMNPKKLGGTYQDLIVNRSNVYYNWMLYQHTNDGSIQLHGSAQNKSSYIPTLGRWVNITATVDSSGNYNLYANGTVVQSLSGYSYAIMTPASLLCIGAFGTSNLEPYTGSIMDASVYNRALSAQEVKQNYFGAPIVTDGLVFAVDANNIISYPKSGTDWYGLTGSYDATLVNGPSFDLSNGGSIVFDGTDDYGILNPSCIPTGNEISISFWNYGINAQNSSIIAASQNSSEQTLNIHLPWSNNGIYWDCGSPFNRIDKIATNAEYQGWHHWVFTKNASTGNMSIYLDGLLWHSGTGLTSTIPAMNIARIGSYWNNAINHNGRIAQCLIYNRALNATEIQQNYQTTQYRFGL